MPIYVMTLLGLLAHAALSGSRVAVSLYALDLGASQVTVGILIALYAFWPVLLSIAVGKFSDRVAPRLPMTLGTVGMGVALVLPPVFPGLAALYVSSVLMGLGHLFFSIAMQAVVGGMGEARDRAKNYATVSLGFSVAIFVGPLVAGLSIDHIGHLGAFMMLASFTVLCLLILQFKTGFLPTGARHSGDGKTGSVLELWRMPDLRATFIAGGIVGSAWDLFQFYLPVYGHSIGLSASAIGAILSTVAVATFVIRAVVPWLMNRLSEVEVLTCSIFIAAFAFVLLPFFENAYVLGAIAFLLGLGIGCAQPMTMSLIYTLTPPGRVAESTGLRKTVNNATHVVVPLIFGSVGSAFGFATVFLSNALVLGAGGLLMRKARLPGRSGSSK